MPDRAGRRLHVLAAVHLLTDGFRRRAIEQPRKRRQPEDETQANHSPRGAPAALQHERADKRKCRHEADAHDHGIHSHRAREPPPEPLAHHGQAHH